MPSLAAPPQPDILFSAEEVQQFARDGFLIVRGLAGASLREQMIRVTLEGLDRLTEPIEYEADLQYPGAPLSHGSPGGHTVRRLKQAHARDTVFTQWLAHPGVVERVRQLLGPDIVCPLAHHNCIMTKEPQFSSETGWHQDIRYWSFARPELVSVWLALGPERPENGCLRLIPGNHRLSPDRSRLDDALFLDPYHPANVPLIAQAVDAPLEAGDVLFFHCRTLHSAGPNRSEEPKLSVVFTYRAADNPPVPGTRSASLPEMLIPASLSDP